MPKNRKKFTEIEYQIWVLYPDGTEEITQTFKYEKPAKNYITKWTPICEEKNIKLDLREARPNVL